MSEHPLVRCICFVMNVSSASLESNSKFNELLIAFECSATRGNVPSCSVQSLSH